jgi:hypothetical protein
MMTDAVGYIASTLVLLTFMTKDMRLLRTTAILSNVAFIAYGSLGGMTPVLLLHLMLLPLNVHRLMELQASERNIVKIAKLSRIASLFSPSRKAA